MPHTLIRREELNADGQKAFDFYTSGTMRGLHGLAGIWRHGPKLAELYRPLGSYLRSGAGLSEPVREVCIMATAREFNNAFEWAAHEPEALRVGVPAEIIQSFKRRRPSDGWRRRLADLDREAFVRTAHLVLRELLTDEMPAAPPR